MYQLDGAHEGPRTAQTQEDQQSRVWPEEDVLESMVRPRSRAWSLTQNSVAPQPHSYQQKSWETYWGEGW